MDLGGECHIAELPFSAPSIGVCDMGVFIPAESQPCYVVSATPPLQSSYVSLNKQ